MSGRRGHREYEAIINVALHDKCVSQIMDFAKEMMKGLRVAIFFFKLLING